MSEQSPKSSLSGVRSHEAMFAESIIDTMRDLLLVLNGNLHVVLASHEFYHIFGVTREETEGRLVYELGNSQWNIPRLRTLLEEILPKQATFRDFEVEHVFEKIGRKVMLLNARKLHQGPGTDEKILLVIEDATDRRDAEEARREAETRFTEMVKNVRDHSIFLTDPDGIITSWNVAAERVMGYSGAEAIGKHFSLIFTAEDLGNEIPESELRIAREEGRAEDERWHQRKGGERFWALGIVTPLHDLNGRLTGFSKILRDMTERKHADDALRESEVLLKGQKEAFESAVGGAPLETCLDILLRTVRERAGGSVRAAFYIVDGTCLRPVSTSEGMPESYSRRVDGFKIGLDSLACGLAAASGSPIITRDVFEEPLWAPWLHLAREFDFRGCWSFPIETHTGKPIGTFAMYHRQPCEATTHDLALANTITQAAAIIISRHTEALERKRAEAALYESEEALRNADRRKDDFLALLAHELRNPLAPIRNGLQVLRLSDDREKRERSQAMMDRQLTHMVRLIDDLLDVSRINRNKMELRRSRILLADALSSAIETARPMIEERGHELMTEFPADPIALDADLTRLSQVFSNLLTNSAKYTERGGNIHLSAELTGTQAVVRVRDDGIGIPSESLGAIFDMFSQVDRSIERATGGLGIGLALVKGLVEMHGGTVTAASEGRGSEFTVRLPVIPAYSDTTPTAGATPASAGPKRRILVVDDNRDSAQSMAEMLQLLGNEIAIAYDGFDAIEQAEVFLPEVILMDVGMPQLNGLEASRRIRQEPWGQKVTIIALTGWGQDSDRSQSQDAGCNGHLVKPVSLSELERILKDVQA